jgi:hypothetical protein
MGFAESFLFWRDPETATHQTVTGGFCTERVPFRHSFHSFSAKTSPELLGFTTRPTGAARPLANAWGKHGHPAATDAPEGAFRAKKWHSGPRGRPNISVLEWFGAKSARAQ